MSLIKTRGIVLNQIRYGDSGIIVRIYTEHEGLLSFLVKGVRKKGSKQSAALYTHLSSVDLVFNQTDHSALQHIREIQSNYVFQHLYYDMKKSAVGLFMTEILYNAIKQDQPDTDLFNYIRKSVLLLDQTDKSVQLFHINFLIGLTQFLGFRPMLDFSNEKKYFDLINGCFVARFPEHDQYLNETESRLFSKIMNEDKSDDLNRSDIHLLLDICLKYYSIHLSGFKSVNSLKILKEVFE